MDYIPYSSTELAEEVEAIFYLGNYSPGHPTERLIPDGYAALVIELDGKERSIYHNDTKEVTQICQESWFSGLYDAYLTFEVLPETELIAVRFKPGGSFPFIPNNMNVYTNQVIKGDQVFGESITHLRRDLLNEKDPMQKLKLVETYLINIKERSLHPTIKESLNKILLTPSIQKMQSLVDSSGYSKKHFIDLFKQQVGLSPKLFQRIIKFQQILPKIQEKKMIQWTQISYECGYYDQAHFIRDFKRFSGYNPSAFLAQEFDRNNFFPENNKER
jgi:AraC-like DNA-binding protein